MNIGTELAIAIIVTVSMTWIAAFGTRNAATALLTMVSGTVAILMWIVAILEPQNIHGVAAGMALSIGIALIATIIAIVGKHETKASVWTTILYTLIATLTGGIACLSTAQQDIGTSATLVVFSTLLLWSFVGLVYFAFPHPRLARVAATPPQPVAVGNDIGNGDRA